MKTIAEQINWDFDANGTLVILNKNGKQIYWERFNGQWQSWNGILRAMKSTLRIQVNFGKSVNTIPKAMKSTIRTQMV